MATARAVMTRARCGDVVARRRLATRARATTTTTTTTTRWRPATTRARARGRGIGIEGAIEGARRGWGARTLAAKSNNRGRTAADEDEDEDDEEALDEDFDVEEEVAADEELEVGGEAIDAGGTDYGEMALEALRDALASDAFAGEYDIFSFKVNASRRRVLASVDKLNDKYGSPTLDELTTIVRAHNAILDERGFPEDVAVELASPGAMRSLRVPRELERFRDLVMDVTYKEAIENPESTSNVTKTMEVTDISDTEVEWKLADVPANRPAKKGQGMNKKSREWRLRMPLDAVVRANLFIDI